MIQRMLPPDQAWTFARLPYVLDAYDIKPHSVVHIGAHHGEEVPVYRDCGFEQIILVEPDPRNVAVLRDRYAEQPGVSIVAAAVVVDFEPGPVTLYHAERTVWSGLTPHPTADGTSTRVTAVRLGAAFAPDTNVLVLDTQGSELDLLKTADLTQLDLVIIETTRRRNDTAAYFDDVVEYMRSQGWHPIEEWVHDGSGYTDTLFVRDA